jgi:threonine 3-dehydrogenase
MKLPGEGMKDSPILVTGATGFIGSHLVRQLLRRGEKVIASNNSGSTRNLDDLHGQVEITRANIGCFTDVLRLVETYKPRIIYHIGAMLAPACDGNPEAGIQANAMGTYYILEAARLFGVRQVIFASSLSVFSGAFSTEEVIHDFSVTRPDFIYGAAKLFSENLGLFYKRQYGLDYRGIRLPNVIGPGALTHGYLEYFNKTIEESARGNAYIAYVGPQTRIPVIHIQDAARAFIELASAPLTDIQTVNYIILGPTPLPTHANLTDIVRAKIPGARIDYRINEPVQKLIDSITAKPYQDSLARKEWGWKYRYGLPEMVDSFLKEKSSCESV